MQVTEGVSDFAGLGQLLVSIGGVFQANYWQAGAKEADVLPAIVRTGRFIAAHPLTRERKLAAFARFARWQVESRLHAEVVVPWIGGTRLAVRRGMHGVTGNIYCGLHDFTEMAFLLHLLRAGDLFADIGANVGTRRCGV